MDQCVVQKCAWGTEHLGEPYLLSVIGPVLQLWGSAGGMLSCVVSFADLDTIVKIIGPVLDACYPAAIVIAMYYCLCRRIDAPANLMAGKWAVISAFLISMLQLAVRYSEMFDLGWNVLSSIYYSLPLAGYSLAWLPVCVIVFIALNLCCRSKKTVLSVSGTFQR